MKVEIRSYQPQDRPYLVQFMALLQEVESSLHQNRSVAGEIADGHFQYLENITRSQTGKIFVAQSLQDIVGFLVCFVEKLDNDDLHVIESERKYGYISDLYVCSSIRKQGVGVALMQAAENHFHNLGLKVIRVGVLANNHLAANFYPQVGYQPYEIVYEKYLG